MAKARKSTDDWMKIIHECRTSGLSDLQWCEDNGISPSTFYYNIKKLRKKACEVPASQKADQAKVLQEVVPVTIIDDDRAESNSSVSDSLSVRKTVAKKNSSKFLDTAADELSNVSAVTVDFRELHISILNTASADIFRHVFATLAELC